MSELNLLKFRADILNRRLKLFEYLPEKADQKIEDISRYWIDYKVNDFSSFVSGNFRR